MGRAGGVAVAGGGGMEGGGTDESVGTVRGLAAAGTGGWMCWCRNGGKVFDGGKFTVGERCKR